MIDWNWGRIPRSVSYQVEIESLKANVASLTRALDDTIMDRCRETDRKLDALGALREIEETLSPENYFGPMAALREIRRILHKRRGP